MPNTLPCDHPYRNRPLAGCWYRWVKGGPWRAILPSFGIAKATYNDLGPQWTDNCIFSWSGDGDPLA